MLVDGSTLRKLAQPFVPQNARREADVRFTAGLRSASEARLAADARRRSRRIELERPATAVVIVRDVIKLALSCRAGRQR
jgi:hypothetical protein